MRFLVGALIFVGVLSFTIFGAGGWYQFWDAPTAIIFLGFIASVVVFSGGAGLFGTGIRVLLSKKHQISQAERVAALRFFKMLRRYVHYIWVITAVIGTVQMLWGINWHYISYNLSLFLSQVSMNVALLLVALFWAVVVNMLFISPIIYELECRADS